MNDNIDLVDDISSCGRFLIDNARDIVGDTNELDSIRITIYGSRTSPARVVIEKEYFPGNLGL